MTKLISSKATGDLAQIRKGAGDLSRMASQYGTYEVGNVIQAKRSDQRFVVLTMGGADSKKRKQMEMRQEDGGWKVLAVN